MPPTLSLGESVAEASGRLNDILASEHDFPNLAAHIFLQRLFGESPLVFHRLVLEHNLLGKVYTPDVAVGIRYYHLWAKRFISPENRSLVLRDEEMLDGKPVSELKTRAFREKAKGRVKERILDYMHRRHNFFATMSNDHTPVGREDIRVIFPRVLFVITDSERILGIGDQGSGGAHISAGKLNCYFLGNGMFPGYALPIGVDVGTNNKAKLKDPNYDGVRHERLRDEDYYPFMEMVLDAVAGLRPGVVQFEDYKGERAWSVLNWFYRKHPAIFAFNDDSQGTGSVVIAGLLAAEKLAPDLPERLRVVSEGAGGAAVGITQQIHHYLRTRGLSESAVRHSVILADSAGILYGKRTVKRQCGREEFADFQLPYILRGEQENGLMEAAGRGIRGWKPGDRIPMELAAKHFACNCLIGTSTTPGKFHTTLISELHDILEKRGGEPLILEFPLSNPTAQHECLTEKDSEAYKKAMDDPKLRNDILASAVRRHIEATKGRLLLATGSPFPAVEWKGRLFEVGQCNNVFVFPGIGLALDYINAKGLMNHEQKIKLDMVQVLFDGARGLASMLDREGLENGRLYPEGTQLEEAITSVALTIIRDVAKEKATEADIAGFRWTDSQKPEAMHYDSGIVRRAAGFSLDGIRKDLLAFRELEKRHAPDGLLMEKMEKHEKHFKLHFDI